MRMITEYLKCGVLDLSKDLNRAFKQNYNFNKYDKDYEWVTEKPSIKQKRPNSSLNIKTKIDANQTDKLNSYLIEGKKTPLPWGWWMKATYDENYNFSVDDLPPETFEPPPSP